MKRADKWKNFLESVGGFVILLVELWVSKIFLPKFISITTSYESTPEWWISLSLNVLILVTGLILIYKTVLFIIK